MGNFIQNFFRFPIRSITSKNLRLACLPVGRQVIAPSLLFATTGDAAPRNDWYIEVASKWIGTVLLYSFLPAVQ